MWRSESGRGEGEEIRTGVFVRMCEDVNFFHWYANYTV